MAGEWKPTILLLVGWYFPDSVGGTEMYVRCLAADLLRKGWNVSIAAPSRDEREDSYIYEGIPVFRYPITTKPGRPELRLEKEPEYFEVFKRWISQHKPDIVHMHSFTRGCGYFHAQYTKSLGIPLVITIHAADFLCVGGTSMRWGEIPCDGSINAIRCTSCWVKKCGMPWFIAWVLARVPLWASSFARHVENKIGTAFSIHRLFLEREKQIQSIFRFSDHIIAVSKWLYYALHLNGVPHEKITLCRHGLPSEFIPGFLEKPQRRVPDVLRLGFLGRFNSVKGLHVLVKAVRGLPLSCKIELRIYGRINNPEENAYYAWVRRLIGKDPRIMFCGEVSKENRQEVFSSLDCLAVPSVWFETGPLVVLEAFAAGVPVIGSNMGGLAELISHGINGLLVSVGDVHAWRACIRWVYENPHVIEEWRAHIPAVKSSTTVAEEMDMVYKRLLKG